MNRTPITRLISRVCHLPALPSLAQERFRKAAWLIEELIQAIEARTAGELPDADTLRDVVRHLRKIGDPSAAEQIAARGAHATREAGDGSEAAWLLSLAGLAHSDQGLFLQAESHYSEGLRLLPRSDPFCLRPGLLSNYGNALTELGDFPGAVATYEKALRALARIPDAKLEKAKQQDRATMAGAVRNNLAWCYMRWAREGRGDDACVGRAARILARVIKTPLRPRTRIIAMGNLAELHIMREATAEAEWLLSVLEHECRRQDLEWLLPEVFTRRAQLWAARHDTDRALLWARHALRSSLTFVNLKQELRIAEVFLDLLCRLLAEGGDRFSTLQRSGALVLDELLHFLRTKDWYTGDDHSRRVAQLSREIAADLACSDHGDETWGKEVELGGMFHDVGKLMIPWSLLNKVRPLSPTEIEQLHLHVTAGQRILERLGLPALAAVVSEHHERPDGTGYPAGRHGVSLAGSIVAAADAYEAMTSPSRRYTQPKRPEEAVDEILAKAGAQFDPRVAHALARVVLRGETPSSGSRRSL